MAFYSWSLTPASNANADTTINWAEGQAPATVNDSSRIEMTRLREWGNDIAGAIVTAGTNVAYTVTSNQAFDTLPHLSGQVIAFTPHTTNAATVTLNVDSLGAKPLRISPGVELPSGSIIQGTPYVALYSNSDGSFYLQGGFTNPYNIPLCAGMDYWGPTAPNSAFAFPSGQAISRTTYATAFALMSTNFGSGDGSTTFNLPDKRGFVSAGVDNMGGTAANRLTGFTINTQGGGATMTLAAGNLPPHTHSGTTGAENANHTHAYQSAPVSPGVTTFGGGLNGSVGANGAGTTGAESASHGHPFTTDGGSGLAATPISLLQPTIACNYILRII